MEGIDDEENLPDLTIAVIPITEHLEIVAKLDARLDGWIERCFAAERHENELMAEIYTLRMELRADSADRATRAASVGESVEHAREVRSGLPDPLRDIRHSWGPEERDT